MSLHLFAIWLSLVPIVSWGGYYEEPKIFVFLVGLLALFIYWIVVFLKKGVVFKINKVDLFFLFWLLILLISSFLSIDPVNAIVGGGYRHQGVIFFFGLWVVGKTVQSISVDSKEYLGKFIGWVLVFESFLIMSQVVSGKVYFGRPLGTLGEVNAVSGMLAIGLYFIYEYLPKSFSIPLIISVFLSWSKSGILSALTFVTIVVSNFNKALNRILWILLLVVLSAFVYKGVVFPTDSKFENRSHILKSGLFITFERPLLGYGAESGEHLYNKVFFEMGLPIQDLRIDRTHNLFLDVAMWSGYIGLLVFLFWGFYSFKTANINKKYAIVAFLVYSSFQPLSVVHWIYLFVILNI